MTVQARVDGTTKESAMDAFKNVSADHAEATQRWRDAQALRDVRLDDLVRAFDKGLGNDALLGVAREVADSVRDEKLLLENKQEANRAVIAAWKLVQSFNDHKAPAPLIEPEPEDQDSPAVTKPVRGKKAEGKEWRSEAEQNRERAKERQALKEKAEREAEAKEWGTPTPEQVAQADAEEAQVTARFEANLQRVDELEAKNEASKIRGDPEPKPRKKPKRAGGRRA